MRINEFKKKYGWGSPDWWLLILAGVILLFGLLALSSASSVFSYNKWNNTYYLVFHQLVSGFLPGLVLFAVLYKVNHQVWKKYYNFFYFFSLGLLLLIFIPNVGAVYNNAKSWINFFGISFQPAEIVKLTFLIFLAGWLEAQGYGNIRKFWGGFFKFIILLGLILLPIALQPDFGTMMIIAAVSLIVFFAAGAKIFHLVIMGLAGGALLSALAATKEYLFNRLLIFVNPDLDPSRLGYHIKQAIIAIGSGGIIGRGFGKSQQKFAYLPEVYGDSIFAIIAEELGFIVSTILIVLFLILVWRGFKISKNTLDPFGRFLAIGISGWIGFQTLINMAMISGIAPLTGIPLPLISYGGTSLAVTMGALGLLLNISKYSVK